MLRIILVVMVMAICGHCEEMATDVKAPMDTTWTTSINGEDTTRTLSVSRRIESKEIAQGVGSMASSLYFISIVTGLTFFVAGVTAVRVILD